jgi:hypothetical protein
MYATKPIEDLLSQINESLAPDERVDSEQIQELGQQLDCLLKEAEGAEWRTDVAPAPKLHWKQRLLRFWQKIKEKLCAWLSPICPRWRKLISRLKEILHKVSENAGQPAILSAILIAVVVAVVAALIKSLPLIVALLSIIGFVHLARLFEQATRPVFLRGY